jgi:hypothetical protein
MPSDPVPDYFGSDVPVGRSGAWVVERVVFREREYDPASDPRPDCFKFRPGPYTILRRDSVQFMTDLYDEWWTQRLAMAEAASRGGEILITGLGLGLVAEAILRNAPVQRVTVVEASEDVIRLVAPHLIARYGDRLRIMHGDAFTWQPPDDARFSVGWHDIWPDPYTPANVEEMERLEARYAFCCEWQGCWPREYIRALETQQ